MASTKVKQEGMEIAAREGEGLGWARKEDGEGERCLVLGI